MAKKKKRAPAKKKRRVASRKSIKRRAVKKRAPKRVVKKARATKKRAGKPAPAKAKKAKENIIGVVTHYFPKVRAAVVKMKTSLNVGETIKIKGHTTDFKQVVNSMQIDHVPINTAKKGQEIGLLVDSRVRRNDKVLKG